MFHDSDYAPTILFLTDHYPPQPGGLARGAQRAALLADRVADATHVLVLRADAPPGTLDSVREGELWVHRFGPCATPAESGRRARLAIDWLRSREPFDLFHGQYGSTAGFLAVQAARLYGGASYVSLRGNDLERDLYDPERFAALLWTLQHADAVGAVSRALVREAEALTGRTDIRYIPNCVDGTVFRRLPPDPALRDRLGLGPGPVLGFAGELRAKKGAAALIEAFRSLADTDVQLLLVGAVRTEERRLLAGLAAEEPALAARIHQRPYVQDFRELCALYNQMDLVLCPSLWEGMPNAVLEAMACGRPVLASDAGGLPDLIRHGKTGWILSRHELHRLGDAVREVLALPEGERLRVGYEACLHVMDYFPPEREWRELRDAYRAALKTPR